MRDTLYALYNSEFLAEEWEKEGMGLHYLGEEIKSQDAFGLLLCVILHRKLQYSGVKS